MNGREKEREREREGEAGNNHRRHRPSAAIIRRHARLLRARYVDLLQKTLLPSFLLGRDTHYSPLLPFVPCPPVVPPSSPLVSTIFSPLDTIRAPLNARTHTHIHTYITYARISACVHIPGETLKCAAVRANTHACPSIAEVDNPLALPLARPLLPFLTCACSSPAFARRFPWLTLLGCARCVTFVCVSGIHYH